MIERLDMTIGDTDPPLIVTLTQDGTAVDLTGATVRVTGAINDVLVFTDDAPTVTMLTGKVQHDWSAADTQAAGTMAIAVRVTYPSGRIQTFRPLDYVEVHEPLGT